MNEIEALAKAIGERSIVIPRRATYVSRTETGQALVQIEDRTFSVDFATNYMPTKNETVHVWQIDGALFLIGPVASNPTRGVVATTSSTRLTITTDLGTLLDVPFVGAQPLAGDTVALGWSEGPLCLGRISTYASIVPPTPPAPPPPPPAQVRSATFYPIDTGSTDRNQMRWWTAQPYASNSTYGAWVYGGQIKDTIPASAELVSLQFYVAWAQRQGAAPRFVLHTIPFLNAVPGVSAYWEWAPGSGFQTPPDPLAWFNGLKAGGPWFGVGLNQGGYNRFASRAQDGSSGALSIAWKE